MASSSRPRLLFGDGGGSIGSSEAAGSAVSSAGPSADSGSEAAPAGFYVTLVVGAVVLCGLGRTTAPVHDESVDADPAAHSSPSLQPTAVGAAHDTQAAPPVE